MNLPVGELIEEGIELSSINPKQKLEELADKIFSGYIVTLIEGFDGLEEGVLIFKKGILIAAAHEYCKYGITVFGDVSLEQVTNAMRAKYGVSDLISLTVQQADLVTAFNDKLRLTRDYSKGDLAKIIPKKYSTSPAEKTLSQVLKKEESKHDLLKRFGLGGI